MEKLIELLNEYDSWWDYDDYYWPYQYWQDRDAYKYGKYYLVSRDYGFVKWLVENDKIDTSKANDKNLNGYEIELRIRAVKELVADSEEKTVLYLNLLMLLSISDTPIEDLLLYLK